MIVAVHVNGNDTVIVIQLVDGSHVVWPIGRSCSAHLDVMKIDELIDEEHYAVGGALLERVVAMLTKMIDP